MSGSLTLCFFLPQKHSWYKWWMFALVRLELRSSQKRYFLCSLVFSEQSNLTPSPSPWDLPMCVLQILACAWLLCSALHVGLSHVPAQALIEALPVGRRWLWLWFLFSQMDSSISATGILLSELPPQQLHCRGADLSESVCAGTGCQVECVTDHHSNGTDTSPRAAGATGFLHLSNSMCPVYGTGGML